MTAENLEFEADKVRLDWLIQREAVVLKEEGLPLRYFIGYVGIEETEFCYHSTAREAIDAAMKEPHA